MVETIFIFIGLFLLAWICQNIIHEGSHLLVGWVVEGRKPTKLIPWPTKRNGRWYFAYYENGPATKNGSPKPRHIAPLITDWFLVSIWLIVLGPMGNLFAIPFIICPMVDAIVWILGAIRKSPNTDGHSWTTSE
jgi:hypothetical protein